MQGAACEDPHCFAYATSGVLSGWRVDSREGCGQAQSWSTHVSPRREGCAAVGACTPRSGKGAGNPQGLGQGVQLMVNMWWRASGFWGFIVEGIYKGAY